MEVVFSGSLHGPHDFYQIFSYMAAHLFNFDFNAHISPNYRVEYSNKNGTEVSSPAIFQNDKEAIAAALEQHPSWIKIGLNIVVVVKYSNKGLVEVFRKEA